MSRGLGSVERERNGERALERNNEGGGRRLVEVREGLAETERVDLVCDGKVAEVEELVNKPEPLVDDDVDLRWARARGSSLSLRRRKVNVEKRGEGEGKQRTLAR